LEVLLEVLKDTGANVLKLSKKADYGLISMKHLASQPDGCACSAREIAQAYSIPPELLAKILQKLVKQGLLASTHGTNGGYVLAKAPESINIADVIEAIDGPLSLVQCDFVGNKDCLQFDKCNVKMPLRVVQQRVKDALKGTSILELVDKPEAEASPALSITNIESKRYALR